MHQHGAKIKRCSSDVCTNEVIKGGVHIIGMEQSVNYAALKGAQIKLGKEDCV